MRIVCDESPYSLPALEKALAFRFLPAIDFESPEEKQEIRERGIADVDEEARERGRRFAQQIDSFYLPSVSIRTVSEEVGFGLFAEEPIGPGAYAGEYTGIVRRNDRRYFEPFNHYCYRYPVLDRLGIHYVIDATQGHLTRFINHSSRPNLQPVYAYHGGFYHLIFLALREIVPGEQLSYDYGPNYWAVRGRPAPL